MQSNDPIAKAVATYLLRAEKSKIDGRGRTFPGYETLMQPVLSQLSAMFSLNSTLNARDIPSLPLEKLGSNLCSQLFDTYIDLPIWTDVTVLKNHLSKLLSSEHISTELLEAVRHVSESLTQLDVRPTRHEKTNLSDTRARFQQMTIVDLFNGLALIHSFINDVAKYATHPKHYAQRVITLADLSRLTKPAAPGESPSTWETLLQQSITGKYLRLETDFLRRAENWRG